MVQTLVGLPIAHEPLPHRIELEPPRDATACFGPVPIPLEP